MFSNFFKSRPAAPSTHRAGEQAVLIYLDGEDFDRMLHLSDKLTEAIEKANVGMFDGNEIGGDETVLFMYGPNAEVLFNSIEPVLRNEEAAQSARVIIRWGNPGAPQREVLVGSKNHPAH